MLDFQSIPKKCHWNFLVILLLSKRLPDPVKARHLICFSLRSATGYIGGFKEADPDGTDWTFVECAAAKNLPDDKLSKLSVHYAISRSDTNKAVYCIDWLPRAPAKLSDVSKAGAARTLLEFGTLMEAATAANQGIPPICGSWDGGGANHYLNAALLGILPSEKMKAAPFFNRCHKVSLKGLPCWVYRGLHYENSSGDIYWVGGNNDTNHVCKRFSAHLASGTKAVRWGDLMVNLTTMVRGGVKQWNNVAEC